MKIRILDILEETMADGPGLRTSIYCAGCGHHCPGCHNPQSWDFRGGREVSVDELLEVVKAEETGKNIWCYTGFTYEEILADERLRQILPFIDTLVDGPFIQELRDTSLHFRGSSNQRIIHLTQQKDDTVAGTVSVIPYR